MNILRLPTPTQHEAPAVDLAVLGWAAVVAVALLGFFVHVLHEQMDRGEALRAQFKLDTPMTVSSNQARPVRTADASQARRTEGQK